MKRVILICIAIVVIAVSCKPADPVANFNIVSGNGGTAPCAVSFENTSENATSFTWNFGDGSASSEKSPTHTYTSGGSYTVTLSAWNESSLKTATTSKSVSIKENT
ncbi:MAG: PKD domain-containing protein [Bacteroidales bacterium]|nr:PKD domain-containing protein [Bacteroidales bacterium]